MHNSNQPTIDSRDLSRKLRAANLEHLRHIEAQRPLLGTELMNAGMSGFQRDANGRIYDPQAGETVAPRPQAPAASSPVSIADVRIGGRKPTPMELLAAGMMGLRFDSHGNPVHPAGAPLGAVA